MIRKLALPVFFAAVALSLVSAWRHDLIALVPGVLAVLAGTWGLCGFAYRGGRSSR